HSDTFGELADARRERGNDVVSAVHAAAFQGVPPFFLTNSPRVREMYTTWQRFAHRFGVSSSPGGGPRRSGRTTLRAVAKKERDSSSAQEMPLEDLAARIGGAGHLPVETPAAQGLHPPAEERHERADRPLAPGPGRRRRSAEERRDPVAAHRALPRRDG